MPNRTVTHVARASAALLFGVVAPCVMRPHTASAARPQQPATPIGGATATVRSPQGIIGTLPRCDGTASLQASTVDVRVGDVVTVTARERVVCPQLLRARGALFVVGGVPAWAVPSVRNGLAAIVDALGAAGGGRIARVEVGDDAATATWSTSDVERAAIANALRAVDARRGGTAEQWSTALAIADEMFGSLPPLLRPMLIVVDGLPPQAGGDRVAQRLTAAVESCTDRVGHSILIDVSSGGWMVGLPIVEHLSRGTAIVVRAAEGIEPSVSVAATEAIAAFQSPLIRWVGTLDTNEAALVAVAAQPATSVRGNVLRWILPAQGFEATFEVQATYRALDGSPLGEVAFSPLSMRSGLSSVGRTISLLLCIQPRPPGGRIICAGGARATPTPVGIAPPTASPTLDRTPAPDRTPTTTPSRPPIPTSTSGAAPTEAPSPTSSPPARWLALIPLASRG